MASIPDLFLLQIGQESTWGTAVAQTAKLMGIEDCELVPIVESTQIKDKRGSLAPGYESIINSISASGSLSGWVTYEDLPYWLNGVFTADTAGTPDTDVYLYTINPALIAEPVSSFYTIAYGDSDDVYSITGATIQQLTIEGASGEPLMFSVDLIGKQVSTDTLDSLSDRDVTIAMGDHVTLFIDPSSDAAGSTAISANSFSFSLSIQANRELVQHLGSLTPTKYRDARLEGVLDLTFEVDSTSVAFLDSILTSTSAGGVFERVVRIKSTLGTSFIQFDFNGVSLEAPSIFSDEDGISTYTLSLVGQYNSVLGNWMKASVTNSVANLP